MNCFEPLNHVIMLMWCFKETLMNSSLKSLNKKDNKCSSTLLSFLFIRKDKMKYDKKANPFYLSKKWREKRKKILIRDRNECQICKSKGKHTKATIVHHIKHYKDYPGLALVDANLVSVCFYCHEELHTNERNHYKKTKEVFKNEERW